jgi:hypothetical protein
MAAVHRDFDFERDMWIPAVKWLNAQGLIFKREFRTPWGICDLVGLEWEHSRVLDRIESRQTASLGTSKRIAMLQLVPSEATGEFTTKQELSHRLGEPLAEIERELNHLIRARFVRVGENGSLTSSINWAPLHRQIIAVELKLDRVEQAIAQARSHLAFATASFVGFPEALAERIARDHRSQGLVAQGVGLLSVTKSGASVLISALKTSNVFEDPALQMHCVERFWTGYKQNNISCCAMRSGRFAGPSSGKSISPFPSTYADDSC